MQADAEKENSHAVQSSQQQQFKYYSLIERVGTQHKYQYLLATMLVFIFFMNSMTSNNASFIFMNPEFDCYSRGIVTQNCERYVCDNYSDSQIKQFAHIVKYQTIATEFGPFVCKDNYKLAFYRGIQSIGTFFGLLLGMMFSDNISRKGALVLSYSSVTTGQLFLGLSVNIQMVCISLFLTGLGHSIIARIIQIMVSQQTEKSLAKSIILISMIPFTIATMFIGQIFAITSNWRTFTLFFGFVPCLFITLFAYCFSEDSPKYLLKKGEEAAVKSLNRIAKINGVQFRYEIGDLTEYVQKEASYKQIHQVYTPVDIFRYKSLRRTSIAFCFIYFSIDFFFYANNAMVDKVGFGQIVNSYLFGFTSCIGIFMSLLFAKTVPRKLSGIINYTTLVCIYTFLIFFQVSDECFHCIRKYVQIILIAMGFIFFVFQVSIIYVHFVQFYPVSVRNIGSGIPTLFGSVGIFCSQLFIVSAFQVSLTLPFVIMSCVSTIGLINYFFIAQTLNRPLQDQIEQIENEKNEGNYRRSLEQ